MDCFEAFKALSDKNRISRKNANVYFVKKKIYDQIKLLKILKNDDSIFEKFTLDSDDLQANDWMIEELR